MPHLYDLTGLEKEANGFGEEEDTREFESGKKKKKSWYGNTASSFRNITSLKDRSTTDNQAKYKTVCDEISLVTHI